jgi:hypothetical protein
MSTEIVQTESAKPTENHLNVRSIPHQISKRADIAEREKGGQLRAEEDKAEVIPLRFSPLGYGFGRNSPPGSARMHGG